ncbi:MAG: DNA-deoxyinosine glycosylase [Christensenellales bacterium]
MRLEHGLAPVFDNRSRVLVLGSFPSVLSRKNGFYYGHPQNRFWQVLAAVLGADVPSTVEEKKALLLNSRIALWDVIQSCEITGSKDASIKDVIPNDVPALLSACPVERIYANGATAFTLYQKHLLPVTKREIVRLPSTSPANAAWTLDRLIEAWKAILPDSETQK